MIVHPGAPEPGGWRKPRLLTLGGLTLKGGSHPAVGAATQRRPLALLATLAASAGTGVSRDRLQALLWPESDAERARKVLAQTVYAIRRDLGDPGVVLGTTELRLNSDLVAVDLIEFEQAAAAGEWERAVVLYAGPFLDGVHLADAPEFERLVESERQRVGRRVLEIVERLARASEARGDWDVAVGWWRRRSDLDPLCGPATAHLMESLVAAGDIAGALRHARVYEALVRAELGAPPDPVVAELATRLRRYGLPAPARATTTAHEPPRTTPDPGARVTDAPPDAQQVTTPRMSPDGMARGGSAPAPEAASKPPGDDRGAHQRDEANGPPAQVDEARGPAPPPAGTSTRGGGGTPRGAAARRRWSTRAAAAVAIVVVVVAVVLMQSRADPTLDRTRVVVVPFDVADPDPEIRLWSEGMVDVLSRNLDGAGPLRAISPTTVLREWAGHADRETVRAFAGAVGAGTAVYGQILQSGRDSIRVAVTLLDVASGDARGEIRRQQALTHVDQLTDSLTIDILRAIGRAVPIGGAPAVPLGAVSSIEALRAFLQGEQFFRRAAWDSAVGRYEQVVALDSGFALAWRRLGLVASWRWLLQDSVTAEYLLRAGAANRGLGARDSLLVAADSLSAAADRTTSRAAAFAFTRRLFTTLDAALQRYPNDAEVWFAVGEARYHFGFGPVVGVGERETLDALDRAIALDSAFAPAYIHAVELGFNVGGAALGLRYARAYLSRNPTEAAHRGVLLVEPLVDPRRSGSAAVAHLLDTAQTSALVSARTIFRRWPDSAETAVRLSRLLAAGRPSEYARFADTVFMRRRLAEQLAFRGHLAEAAQVLGTQEQPIFAELAYLGAVPHSVAQPALVGWMRAGSERARLALPYWSALRDTAALVAFLAATGTGGTPPTPRSDEPRVDRQARASYDRASTLAHLALARGDSAEALPRFLALPDTLCPECYLDRLTRARLLTAAGRGREAMATLQEPLVAFLTPIEVAFALERARAAAGVGDGRAASEACRFVRAAWARADRALRPAVEEVCAPVRAPAADGPARP